MVVVPTMNPLSRKENTRHNANNKKKVLNPGSCSSAMNLLDIMSLSSSRGGSVDCPINDDNNNNNEYYRFKYYSLLKRGRKSQRTKNILNPGSCGSALNLLDIRFDDDESSSSVRDNMRMMSELTHSGRSSVGYGKNAEW
jgi:predicted phosphodiesterase